MDRDAVRIFEQIRALARDEAAKARPRVQWGVAAAPSSDGVAEIAIGENTEPAECDATVIVHAGDRVMVAQDPVTGRPVVTGNASRPSATSKEYEDVREIAEEAAGVLDGMEAAAQEADRTLSQVITAAATADANLEAIENYVGLAEGYDKTLTQRVEEAEASAGAASQSAASAASEAAAAAQSASSASTSAARAESGLARVQDVVGTVTWLEEHAGPTSDTEAAPGKDYYVYNEVTKTLTPADVQQGDSVAGLWELTESVRDYIASYLALVNGVLRLSNGGTARVELSSKALRFYSENNTVVAAIAVTDDDVSYLNVRKMKIERGMYFDQWRMFRRRNGNLALKWNKLFE